MNEQKEGEKPADCEYEVTYVRGTKRANSRRKTPTTVMENAGLRRIRKSGRASAVGPGSSRDLIRAFAIAQRVKDIRAIICVAPAKPIVGVSNRSIIGNSMPPKAPPVAANPVAVPLLLLK